MLSTIDRLTCPVNLFSIGLEAKAAITKEEEPSATNVAPACPLFGENPEFRDISTCRGMQWEIPEIRGNC